MKILFFIFLLFSPFFVNAQSVADLPDTIEFSYTPRGSGNSIVLLSTATTSVDMRCIPNSILREFSLFTFSLGVDLKFAVGSYFGTTTTAVAVGPRKFTGIDYTCPAVGYYTIYVRPVSGSTMRLQSGQFYTVPTIYDYALSSTTFPTGYYSMLNTTSWDLTPIKNAAGGSSSLIPVPFVYNSDMRPIETIVCDTATCTVNYAAATDIPLTPISMLAFLLIFIGTIVLVGTLTNRFL